MTSVEYFLSDWTPEVRLCGLASHTLMNAKLKQGREAYQCFGRRKKQLGGDS
jgi:hypothetical protein